MERKKAEIANLVPNIDKIIAAISYIIKAASENNHVVTQYDIVKTMFLADRAHLNRYGRLISSDNYVAMYHGPVPTVAYDILKRNAHTMRMYNLDELPWDMEKGERGLFIYSNSDVSWVDDHLSLSDKKALNEAAITVKSLGFGQIRRLTHEDPAYVDAWEDDGDRKQYPMSLGLLFEVPNFDKARELQDISGL
ncbi:Panacea domain-containing protein [Pseudochrobactrum asaccharolyticum]|uniref:Uncharacterized protein DUF4065 n=1 Tax=Pseudochrobactrum asaccharolyticum TaxID=354351 RepID=A0A366DI28_9HYPH|nr:Panacea domain-containing protein [Pseudochrobactrum asaccharolyticum]RBO89666.1 uncharacterized protein DUF4065 [Pseudochrobactrum asaccharolyticum]